MMDFDWASKESCQKLATYFERHIVALHLVVTSGDSAKSLHYSGFLFNYDGVPLWITAGHVIAELQEVQSADSVVIRIMGFVDNYPDHVAGRIPADMASLSPFTFDDDDMDIGVVILRSGLASPLLQNPNLEFFNRGSVGTLDDQRPLGYYLVGLPVQRQESRTMQVEPNLYRTDAFAEIAVMPLHRLERESPEMSRDFWKGPNFLYGKLVSSGYSSPDVLRNIKGMSGGPVVSIEKGSDGELRYYLVAVQSSWLPESRIVRATAFQVLLQGIDGAMSPSENE